MRHHRLSALLLLTGCLLAGQGQAAEARPLADDPRIEQRMTQLAEEMRCLVCQNESLAGSRAGLADDLRRELREQIAQGKSDDEILAFMVARYGDFVLYRPPLKPATWLLWGGPFALLLVAIASLWWRIRRRHAGTPAVAGEDSGGTGA